MESPKFVGLETLNDSELLELKAAIDTEVSTRQEKAAKMIEARLSALIKQVLSSGCSISLSTDTDEITVMPDESGVVCVDVLITT